MKFCSVFYRFSVKHRPPLRGTPCISYYTHLLHQITSIKSNIQNKSKNLNIISNAVRSVRQKKKRKRDPANRESTVGTAICHMPYFSTSYPWFAKLGLKYCVRADTNFWLQEGNIARARYFRTRPETALNAAADPRVASSARHETVWPSDPRYQLHRISRTHRMAISKCSTLPGTEESTRASKEFDNNDHRLFGAYLGRVKRERLGFRMIATLSVCVMLTS